MMLSLAIEQYAQNVPEPVPSVVRTLDGLWLRKALANKNKARRLEMTDDEYMMLPARLFGFSLADRKWSTSRH